MILRLRWLLALSAIAPIGITVALAGPNGATVAGGAASVQGQGTASVVVTQTSQNAIINWQTFNIGAGETAKIIMPGAGATELDRVTGNLGPSQIFGSLTSNGRVFLVNPDGILFGPNSRINAAGFLATTHDIANGDFMAGRYNFTGAGNPAASIVNQGSITAQTGGFAALVAPGVRNTGTITAWLGRVGLASANSFALDLYGDRLIQLNVGDSIAAQVIDVSTGQPLKALVSNEGTIKAGGGQVELTAVAARQIVDAVINNTGVVTADTIGSRNGMITLEAATAAEKPAGAPLQLVAVSGTLSAAGKRKGTSGGTVVVTGESVNLAGAKIDASGSAGGGAVLIGGDWGGGHPNKNLVANQSAYLEPFTVPTATTVSVDATTAINASATGAGNGGKVVVWSTTATTFYGSIAARGGAQSGNGGFVETSGGTVNFAGARVDTSAPAGKTGTWLVDPTDLTVYAATAVTISANLATANVTLQTTATGATGPGVQTSGAGDIIIDGPISWSSNKTLTLDAYNAITFNAAVTIGGAGGLSLTAANNPLAPAAPLISFGNGASVQFTGVPNSGQKLTINGQPYTLLYSMTEVQNINNNLSGYYALAAPLNASAVTNWTPIGSSASSGFSGAFQGLGNTISNLTVNLPSTFSVGLFGYVSGGAIQNVGLLGGSVTGSSDAGGLIGYNNNGTVTNSYATAKVDGANEFSFAGGLIGYNIGTSSYGGTVIDAYATGAVSAGESSYVGGLIGYNNNGALTNVHASGAVTGYSLVAGSSSAGGLVGANQFGAVTNAYATGAVFGNSGVGGLIGYNNQGTVKNAYATGTVSGLLDVGGLVGENAGTVTVSYATGAATGGSGSAQVGGLIGYNTGSVTESYASGTVSGDSAVGGLIGANGGSAGGGTVTAAYATGAVSGQAEVGGLVGYNNGAITQSYATGTVSGGASPYEVGGLVGLNDTSGSVSSSYWDTTTTNQAFGAGRNNDTFNFSATGLATSAFNSTGSFSSPGWSFGTLRGQPCASGGACWVIVDTDGSLNNASGATGATRPMLLGEYSPTITNPHQLQLMELDPTATYTLANNINLGPALSNPSDVWGPNGSAGFVPIGNFNAPFTGSLNGQGNSLNNLTIGSPDIQVGLFGTVGSTGAIQNLGLTNVSVSGIGPQGFYVGGIAGVNEGVISNSWVTGSLTNNSNNSCSCEAGVGGIAGINYGTITQSYANVTIAAASGQTGNVVGGLVAWNPGSISQSFAMGSLSLSATTTAGGSIGGLVGINTTGITTANGPLNYGQINQSYAAATVVLTGSAPASVGGLVGVASPGTTTVGSYWDVTASGQAWSAGGTPLTTTQIKSGLPSGFNATVWGSNSTINNGYPYLLWQTPTGMLVVAGYVYTDAGVTAAGGGISVSGLVNGSSIGAVTTGANGSYNFEVAAGAISSSGSQVLTYTTGAKAGAAYVQNATGSIQNLNIYEGYLNETSGVGTLSAVSADLATAIGSNPSAQTVVNGLGNRAINATAANFTIDQAISLPNGALLLNASGNVTATAAVNVGAFTLAGGNWAQVASTLPGFSAGDFTISGGSFLRASGGNGSTGSPYQIVDVYGLQGIGSSSTLLASNYALANNIDATGTANWNGAGGFVPIGTNGNWFGGSLDGNGHTINGLSIAPTGSNANSIGLFAANDGTIQNLGLTNVSITANANVAYQFVGTLAGQNFGTISNVTVGGTSSIKGGTITGITAGGLVGSVGTVNNVAGTITGSRAAVNVTLGDGGACNSNSCTQNTAGGLVGSNSGSIASSSASGAVVVGSNATAGGLVGWNGNDSNGNPIAGASIVNSSASGAVSSAGVNVQIGGLVGENNPKSLITNSLATGNVSATGTVTSQNNCSDNCQYINAGGLVGQNYGTITGPNWVTALSLATAPTACSAGSTCYSGTVTVGSQATGGGLAGYNDGIITNAFAIATVTGAAGVGTLGSNNNNQTALGGLVGQNSGQINTSFASGTVGSLTTAALQVGGLVSQNSGTISKSFASVAVSAGANSMAGGLVGSNSPSNNSNNCSGCYVGDGDNNTAAITNSGANGNVTAGASSIAGGLVGVTGRHEDNNGVSVLGGSVSGSTASGAVTAGDNSIVGGLAGVVNIAGAISSSSAQNTSVSSTGANSIVGGLVGVNAGSVTGSGSTAPVNAAGNSYVGGLIGINIGTVTQSTVDPVVITVTGNNGVNNSVVGGIVGLNVGSIASTTAQVAINTSGSGAVVGGVAGVNGSYTNPSFTSITIANSSFPNGTITSSTTTASGSGFSSPVGTTTPATTPAVPAWLTGCTVQLCTILADGTLQTIPASVVVTYSVADATSTYGTLATLGAVKLTGAPSGVTATVDIFSGTSTTPTPLAANLPAGIYKEEVVALSNPSYTIASTGNSIGTLTVDPATLTYTANAASRTYGAANPALSGSVTGFVASDTLASATTGKLVFSTAATSSSNVGSHAITGGGLTADNRNYVFVQAASNATALTINPAPVTVTALGGSSIYGSSPANPGLSATGLQNGQTASALTGLSNSFGITSATNAGGYTLSVAGTLTNANYTVTSTIPGAWTVNPAPVTVTALGGSSIYGSSPGNPGLAATGLQNGQTASVLTGLANAFGISNASNVGAYTVNVTGTLTNPNYTVTSLNAGTWTVNPATLTYLADPVSITSGSTIPTLGGTVTGLVNGQTLAAVTTGAAVFSTTATSSSPAGGYPITGTGLTTDTANYVLAQAPGNADAMTIKPAGLTANQAQLVNPAQLTQFVQPITATSPSSGQVVVTQPTASPAHTGSVAPSSSSGPAPQLGPRFFVPPPAGETRYVKNEVLLQVPNSVSAAEFQAMVERLHLTVLSTDELGLLGVTTYRLQIGSGTSVNSVIQALSGFQIVAGAQANFTYRLAREDTAPAAPAAAAAPAQNTDLAGEEQQGDASQYELEKLGLRGVHRLVKGNNVKVAVIDSEIDLNHPDLRGTILEEYDAVGAEDRPDAHGTAMAGAIAAHSRLLGIAPSAQLYAIHAFSSHAASAQSTSFSIIKGLDWAVSKGVRVINMSFAGPRDPAMARALHAAHDAGIVLVAAAGNDGPKSPPLYPAADPDVIAVTATDIHDKVFLRANQGRYIAVAAPGVDIPVPAPEGAYQLTTGTSVASAEVSGMAALLIERNPSLTPDDIRHILTSTARHRGGSGRNDVYGSGLVDPPSAIRAAAGARSAAREPAERAASATSPSVN
jgi:filamentous hemagglutinin family protein